MKRKPIKIDWEAVEDAFNSQNEELVYYLDLVTGHVVLEGEGEEDVFEDEELYEGAATAEPPAARHDTTRIYIDPPDTPLKVEWMQAFLEEDGAIHPEAEARLRAALGHDNPVAEIGDILRDYPGERDRWFLYRSERLHEMIDAWLEGNSVEAIEPPPWR
jgi:hypothetical protein